MKHNKLVRDRIPEIIAEHGERPVTRSLNDVEYRQELKRKLHEEIEEFGQSDTLEELTDILEVVYALATIKNASPEQLESMRREKRKTRGGFDKRILLIETLSDKEGTKTKDA
jgi:predicted house-cleaning noncanonical NTP pyrophosphatase (MazG superfamily)